MRRIVGAALLALLLVVPAAAQARKVRVFAVGPKFGLDWVASRDAYRAHLRGLAEQVRADRMGPTDPARPVATARDLITMPEDLGLMAAFGGVRGVVARQAPDLTTSIGGLLATYAPMIVDAELRFPALLNRPFPPTRALTVALTDTFVRVAVETFAEIADEQDAWLVAGVTLARDWHVVCADKATYRPPPGAGPCAVQDPVRVALLRTPEELTRTYAYEATDSRASTMALVFDPDGKLRAKVVKAYLTPVELPGQLDLVPGDPDGVRVVRTPVGRLGIVTSKDAWMPDVIDKLDARHADVLVQPEFFVGDTIRTTGTWAPDNLRGGGYSALLRSPSITSWVIPELVGNVLDFSADAQQAIAVEPRPGARAGGMLGQPATPGFLTASQWVVPDPVRPDEPIAERRRRLGEAGEKLLPKSGVKCPSPEPGPCEGGHVESVVHADVDVLASPKVKPVPDGTRGPAPFSASRALAPTGGPQRNVALAARDGHVWAAFEERSGSRDRVLVARSDDGGGTWGSPVPVSAGPSSGAQWWPSIAVGPHGDVVVAWQERGRVRVSRSAGGGGGWSPPAGTDGTGPQWRPSVAVTGQGDAILAWVDERGRSAQDGIRQAEIRVAQVRDGVVLPSARLDRTDATAPLAASMDHAWAPWVSARGDAVLVTWLDFRTYDWRVATRQSADGGATWGVEQEATSVPAGTESLASGPRGVLTSAGPLATWANWASDPGSAVRPMRLQDVQVAAVGRPPLQVDGAGDAFRHAFAPALAALDDGGAVVAFQDHERGDADVRVVRVAPGPGTPSQAYRADDDGVAGHGAWRPAVAVSGTEAVIAWEDDRGGRTRLRVAHGRVGDLG